MPRLPLTLLLQLLMPVASERSEFLTGTDESGLSNLDEERFELFELVGSKSGLKRLFFSRLCFRLCVPNKCQFLKGSELEPVISFREPSASLSLPKCGKTR
jgi:hypothetical protein